MPDRFDRAFRFRVITARRNWRLRPAACGSAYLTVAHSHRATGEYDYLAARVMPGDVGTGSVTVTGSSRNFPLILGGTNTSSGGLRITSGGVVSLSALPDADPIFNTPFRGDAALGA